jgi:hypothetical protein
MNRHAKKEDIYLTIVTHGLLLNDYSELWLYTSAFGGFAPPNLYPCVRTLEVKAFLEGAQ